MEIVLGSSAFVLQELVARQMEYASLVLSQAASLRYICACAEILQRLDACCNQKLRTRPRAHRLKLMDRWGGSVSVVHFTVTSSANGRCIDIHLGPPTLHLPKSPSVHPLIPMLLFATFDMFSGILSCLDSVVRMSAINIMEVSWPPYSASPNEPDGWVTAKPAEELSKPCSWHELLTSDIYRKKFRISKVDEVESWHSRIRRAVLEARLLCFECIAKNEIRCKHLSDERLHYLHRCRSSRICHVGDVKPANVLLDSNDMVAKLGDFGIPRLYRDEQTRFLCGYGGICRGYMAPEYLGRNPVTYKSDVYSLGVVMLEILMAGPTRGRSDNCSERSTKHPMVVAREELFIRQVPENWGKRREVTVSEQRKRCIRKTPLVSGCVRRDTAVIARMETTASDGRALVAPAPSPHRQHLIQSNLTDERSDKQHSDSAPPAANSSDETSRAPLAHNKLVTTGHDAENHSELESCCATFLGADIQSSGDMGKRTWFIESHAGGRHNSFVPAWNDEGNSATIWSDVYNFGLMVLKLEMARPMGCRSSYISKRSLKHLINKVLENWGQRREAKGLRMSEQWKRCIGKTPLDCPETGGETTRPTMSSIRFALVSGCVRRDTADIARMESTVSDGIALVAPAPRPHRQHLIQSNLTDERSDKPHSNSAPPAANSSDETSRAPVQHNKHVTTGHEAENHSEPNPFVAECDTSEEEAKRAAAWFVATGAANHATGDPAQFTNLQEEPPADSDDGRCVVHAADGTPMAVRGRGDVVTETVVLRDVYYIPGLRSSLVSVGQLAGLGYSVGFGRGACFVSSAAGAVVGRAHATGDGLYEVDFLRIP